MTHYTLAQLAAATGRTVQTLRWHIRHKYLPTQKIKGARGWRVTAKHAREWAAKNFGVKLDA